MFSNVLIGADPELFLKNPNSGQFVSGHGMIPGEKHHPHPVDKGAVQVDGTALEFNIYPSHCEETFVANIRDVRTQLAAMVPGYQLVAEPVADYDPVYFKKGIPASAKRLGCDPDFNAWTCEPNAVPDARKTFRTGSGHIHIGWTKDADTADWVHFELCTKVCRQLDYYLGVYSLLWDPDNRRRELYGKAGAFRPKPYGVEYRVLSNRWLSSELLTRWVYRATRRALDDYDKGLIYENFHGPMAQDIIDNNKADWPTWNIIDIQDMPMPPKAKVA